MSRFRYCAPAPGGRAPAFLVAARGTNEERWCAFYDQLQIGRDEGESGPPPGVLLIADATVSRSHCVLTRRGEHRCVARDSSRNGTRIDGRRVMPNVDVELRPGQTLAVGERSEFVIVFQSSPGASPDSKGGTLVVPSRAMVTVVVGDIRDYTRLVRRSTSADVQQSVASVFRRLTEAVITHGGSIKEFQGDAVVAFWEGTASGEQAIAACAAVLELDQLAERLAHDRRVWRVPSFPLTIDWALASGSVLIDSFGASRPAGLLMIGEAPILAFRLEKLASESTGRILVCPATWELASSHFRFRDLGEVQADGFDRPDHVFALEGTRSDTGK
jgi:adenylate cyclase